MNRLWGSFSLDPGYFELKFRRHFATAQFFPEGVTFSAVIIWVNDINMYRLFPQGMIKKIIGVKCDRNTFLDNIRIV